MRSNTALSRRDAARSAVLSQWVLWTSTESSNPAGFPCPETDFCMFADFMSLWHPHTLAAGRCDDRATLRALIKEDGLP